MDNATITIRGLNQEDLDRISKFLLDEDYIFETTIGPRRVPA